MSRSRSPEKTRQSPESRDRRLSVASNHSRPSMDQDDIPSKRARTDTRSEDKQRGKRLFGNILGTLKQFKKDDKTSRTSEAAKRREQVSERIASKIRTEHALQHDIMGTEKSYRELRSSTDNLEHNIKEKEISLQARHANIQPASRFLHTSLPPSAPPLFDGGLLNPSPIPLNQGPSKNPHPHNLRPLFFLPAKLLPEQQSELASRIANIEELISEEKEAFTKEKEIVLGRIKKNRKEIIELNGKLAELKKNVKPLEIRGRAGVDQTDELGRERRESTGMEVEGDGEAKDVKEGREKEAGLQIRGENGDVEVEY